MLGRNNSFGVVAKEIENTVLSGDGGEELNCLSKYRGCD